MIMRRSIKEGRREEWYKNGRLSGKSTEWQWVHILMDLFEVCHPVLSIYFQPHPVFTDYTIPEVQVQAQGKAQERLEV